MRLKENRVFWVTPRRPCKAIPGDCHELASGPSWRRRLLLADLASDKSARACLPSRRRSASGTTAGATSAPARQTRADCQPLAKPDTPRPPRPRAAADEPARGNASLSPVRAVSPDRRHIQRQLLKKRPRPARPAPPSPGPKRRGAGGALPGPVARRREPKGEGGAASLSVEDRGASALDGVRSAPAPGRADAARSPRVDRAATPRSRAV